MSRPYILGIDLGTHSLGWALIALGPNAAPSGIIRAGVRTFEAGVDATPEGMIEGKQQSRAAARREKRGPRRQFWRRAWRRYKVLKCMTEHGLLTMSDGLDIRRPTDQNELLRRIDAELHDRLRRERCRELGLAEQSANGDSRLHLWEQVWLYELRASGLERQLDPIELGRALYHLAQRRGFRSNRKTDATADEDSDREKNKARKKAPAADDGDTGDANGQKDDPKKVKAGIERLDQAIKESGARTIGQYFARHVDPHQWRIRGPRRWTGRTRYEAEFNVEDEFNAICDHQAQFYPNLKQDAPFRKALRNAIFKQRRLKPTGHLVGHCSLEPDRRRALQAIPIAQRFRMLQTVNDLEIIESSGEVRPLHDHERASLLDALYTRGDLTFHQIRELLNLNKPRRRKMDGKLVIVDPGDTFSHERPPIEKIPGDRTTAKILVCDEKAPGIARRWREMGDRQREELVLAILEFERSEGLAAHLVNRFGFSVEQAAVLKDVQLEKSRTSLSRRAMQRLLYGDDSTPLMESRMKFAHAKEAIAEYRAMVIRQSSAFDLLPPVVATDRKKLGANRPCFREPRDLRHPAVTRALTELRKVVNAIVRRFGKPHFIRIELARELKLSAKERARIAKEMVERRDYRDKAAEDMQRELGLEPNDRDKELWRLGIEQAWTCPYCGQQMEKTRFLSGAIHVDHIIPRSLCFDNRVPNKVLCHAECNAAKGKRAPCHAFDQAKLHEIELATAHLPVNKRVRFKWTEEDIRKHYADEDGSFTQRQLRDTQYASRLAAEYLGLLYGGVVERKGIVDEAGTLRVQPSPGRVTNDLRREWNLHNLVLQLPDCPAPPESDMPLDKKVRIDHRHHAVDAMVIALTGPRAVQHLTEAAKKIEEAELRGIDIRDSQGRRRTRYAEIPQPPWGDRDSFVRDAREAIAKIKVSRRPERKVAGPMHAETNYSREIETPSGKVRRVRIPVSKLTGKQLQKENERIQTLARISNPSKRAEIESQMLIPHERVREAILAKWSELGGEPKKAFANPENHPRMPARDGRQGPPIHTVRINVTDNPKKVGHGARLRHVVSGKDTLHHAVVVKERTKQGERWTIPPIEECGVVDRLTAYRKLATARREGRKLIKRGDGREVLVRRGPEVVMWLCKGDYIEMDDAKGGRALYLIKFISKATSGATEIKVRLHNDARIDKQIEAAGERQEFRITSVDDLRKRKARKATVTPLGEVVYESPPRP